MRHHIQTGHSLFQIRARGVKTMVLPLWLSACFGDCQKPAPNGMPQRGPSGSKRQHRKLGHLQIQIGTEGSDLGHHRAPPNGGPRAVPRPDQRASPRLWPLLGAGLCCVCFCLGPPCIAARTRRRTAYTRPVKSSDLSPLPFCAFSVAF